MDYRIGDVVKSKAGHDKGVYYVVIAADGSYVLVANGKNRAIDSPKRKKNKLLQYVGCIDETACDTLGSRTGAFFTPAGTGDSELRKLLKAFEYGNSKIMIER